MSFQRKPEVERRLRRFSPLLWTASVGAIAVLALGITGTLSQYTASITNTNNNVETAGPESFGFSESLVVDGQPVTPACATASAGDSVNCDTINKNGEIGEPATPIAPGGVRNTTVRLLNTAIPAGLAGDLTLTVEPCTQVPLVGSPNPANNDIPAGDLCGTVVVTVSCATSPASTPFDVGPVTLTAFAAGSPYVIAAAIPPGGYADCTFTTSHPIGATAPALQGITTSQPMTWTFTQST
jgi:hypothetical protein